MHRIKAATSLAAAPFDKVASQISVQFKNCRLLAMIMQRAPQSAQGFGRSNRRRDTGTSGFHGP